jgi:hypothetical protein
MPELWEEIVRKRITGGSLVGAQHGQAAPRAGLLQTQQPAPEFGTSSAPGYVLDPSGQYVQSAPAGPQRLDRAGAERLHRESPAGFLEDLRQPSSEFVPMNALQSGIQATGQALQRAPLPLGIGEAAGRAIESGATGRATATGVAEGVLDAVNFVPAAWGIKGSTKLVAEGLKNVSRQLPKGASVRAETFSPQRLEVVHPDYAGTNPGMRGAESGRRQVQGSYWYDTGVQAMPEGGIGTEGHRADLTRVLMPGTKEQKKIRAEAARNVRREAEVEAKRGGYAPAVDQAEIAYEFERLTQERGYKGYAAELPSGRVIKYFDIVEPDQATRRAVNRPTSENIARHMRDNPEGGSIYPATGSAPVEGIAVARPGYEQVAEGVPSQGLLSEYMAATGGPDDMVGWWQNQGQTYLDRSRVHTSPLAARAAGELGYQRAAYDIGRGEEIPMTVRPLVEQYQAYRARNIGEAGGQKFGQRGAIAPAGLRPMTTPQTPEPQGPGFGLKGGAPDVPDLKIAQHPAGGGIGYIPGISAGERISTRLPTAVSSTEDPFTQMLEVNLDSAMLDPKMFGHNIERMTEYRNFQGLRKERNLRKRSEMMIEHMRSNLNYIFEQMPAKIRNEAQKWYDGANRLVNEAAQKYNISKESAAAVYASLSPQTEWFINVTRGDRMMDIYFNHAASPFSPEMAANFNRIRSKVSGRPAKQAMLNIQGKRLVDLNSPLEKALWIRLFDESHNSKSYKIITPSGKRAGTMRNTDGSDAKMTWPSAATMMKALSVIEDPSMRNISLQMGEAHKVRSFYNNMVNPYSTAGDVTSDTHQIAANMMLPMGSSTSAGGYNAPVLHNFGGTPVGIPGPSSSGITGIQGTYPIHREAVVRAASDQGILPRQMQSVTWEGIRSMFRNKSPQVKASAAGIWDNYSRGLITQAEAQQAIYDLTGGMRTPTWATQ